MIVPIAVAAVCGLVIGCFLNTLAYRLTSAGKAVITEDCICPICGHRLALWEQIPLLGYLLLHGKCRYCHADIAVQYPLVEGGCAVLYGVLAGICLPALHVFGLVCLIGCFALTAWLVWRGGGMPNDGTRAKKCVSAVLLLLFYHVCIAAAVGIVLLAG